MMPRLHAALDRPFVRFVIAGLVNTLVGYAIYAALVLLRLPPQLALALSFGLGVIWNYFTTARFVFRVSGFSRLPAYAACYLAVWAANSWALSRALTAGMNPLLAQALLTPVSAVLTFLLVSRVMRRS